MADLVDAENAILAALLAVVYPAGTTQPSAIGTAVEIFRGWPQEQNLNAALAAGKSVVSIFPKQGHDRGTDLAIGNAWRQGVLPLVTIAVATAGNVATLSGTPAAGQIVALTARSVGFSYAVQAADTLSSIAAALAALFNADGRLKATSSGPTVTVAAGNILVVVMGQVGGYGTLWREIARRQTMEMVTCWAPTPDARDALGGIVDRVLGDVEYLAAPDTTAIKIELNVIRVSDGAENATLYVRARDILCTYSITQTVTAAQMLLPGGTLREAGATVGFGVTLPIAGIAVDTTGAVLTDTAGNAVLATAPGLQGGPVSVPLSTIVAEVAAKVSGMTQAKTSFVFTQGTPSARWDIVHNLGLYPDIVTVDSTGREVEGDVQYMSINEIAVTFSSACSGSAYLN